MRDRIQEEPIQFGHFQALRGNDQFKEFDTIFITGRNQPPQAAVDGIARAIWWDDDVRLISDDAANLNAAPETNLAVEPRGYLLTEPDKHYGVNVRSFTDQRVELIHEQLREAETIQAIARLRLVHAEKFKNVYLLSNLPIEMPVDNLISWTDLMPSQAEIEFVKRGDIPLSPMGWVKMRPDLFSNVEEAKKPFQRWGLSKEREFLNFSPLPLRLAAVVLEFRQVVDGKPKGRRYEHLFRVSGLDTDDHGITTGHFQHDKAIELLRKGYTDTEGSGWGEVECTGVRWLEAPEHLTYIED